MAQPGTELILGCRRDPVFGPIVLVGIGGIFTEIFRDTVIDLAPVDEKAALALLQRLKGAVLLNGYRAQKPMDIISIAGAIAAEQPGRLPTFTKASPRWACPATPRRSAPSLPLAAWWNTPGSAA